MTEDHPQRDLLIRYVDNELGEPDRSTVESLLASDANAREFVVQLTKSKLPLSEAFEPLLNTDIPDSVVDAVNSAELSSSPVKHFSGSRFISGLAAGLVLGCVATGFLFLSKNPQQIPVLVTEVAQYQSLYQRATVSSAAKPDTAALKLLIKTQFNKDISIPDLSDFNVKFVRGQLLQSRGKPLIQLVYLADSGVPIALCFTQNGSYDNSNPSFGESFGLQYGYTTHDDLEVVLVGGDNVSIKPLLDAAVKSFGDS